jgi:ABC-type sugar transport system substrate-binding protein
MKSKALVVAFALASMALVLFIIRRQSSGPAINLRPSVAVGEVLAQQTARLLGDKGKMVVIGRASAKDGQSASSEQISSFRAAVARQGSPTITATEWLPRPAPGTMDLGGVTAEQLLALIAKHPEADAFVVFAGMPPLSPALAERLTARSLKVLAVCGYGATVRRWLEAQALAVAVVPRFGEPPPATSAPKTVQDWFEREFEMLTPQSVGRLPY